ncbi:hypothetical protein QUF54_02515 [Candidatus Marithioploca araucensis]|uniref:Uncharacterized protein n=1 Tax=Candidatus Marithioploca araucensis TaxID=70273 RepID=A0ABT7VRB2_9GAMM|nr:hypothetical protein [Candidatus Marithioploca araucensis]
MESNALVDVGSMPLTDVTQARCFQVPPISSVAIHISPGWG